MLNELYISNKCPSPVTDENAHIRPWISKRMDWLDSTKNPWEKVQDREELKMFLPWLRARNFHSILEIGVRTASNLYMMAGALANTGTITGLDIKGQKPAVQVKEKLLEEGIVFTYIFGDSAELLELIPEQKFDFIYVDGDHHYEKARSDYEKALLRLNPGGLIGFHDISPLKRPDEVDVLWRELESRMVFKAIRAEGRCGIGVIDPQMV